MASKKFSGPHIGFAGFLIVITIGLILMLLNVGFSLGGTIRIPFTNINLTGAGCIGQKAKATQALPAYVQGKLGDNHDFINHSMIWVIGPIEGCEIAIIGRQLSTPPFNIHISIK
jgi:hypothetical protein